MKRGSVGVFSSIPYRRTLGRCDTFLRKEGHSLIRISVNPFSTTVLLKNLWGMNSMNKTTKSHPRKRILTLCVSNASLNPSPRTTVKFTVPSYSRSIRATPPATRRRSLPKSLTRVSVFR